MGGLEAGGLEAAEGVKEVEESVLAGEKALETMDQEVKVKEEGG